MSETDGQADLPGRYDGRCGWDKLTPEERSAEMKRRAAKRKRRK